jgi:hypothetical protein
MTNQNAPQFSIELKKDYGQLSQVVHAKSKAAAVSAAKDWTWRTGKGSGAQIRVYNAKALQYVHLADVLSNGDVI